MQVSFEVSGSNATRGSWPRTLLVAASLEAVATLSPSARPTRPIRPDPASRPASPAWASGSSGSAAPLTWGMDMRMWMWMWIDVGGSGWMMQAEKGEQKNWPSTALVQRPLRSIKYVVERLDLYTWDLRMEHLKQHGVHAHVFDTLVSHQPFDDSSCHRESVVKKCTHTLSHASSVMWEESLASCH